ncbi:TVP38/TMEM64 family protein [Salarchaeum sp. JOR-1]|uniref:TVP38/TMEM64 family protein n=1 Tax=Salarchaeum sp. JOR-1 TaxID=2599399 RepID=UPI001198C630|nr:TVP38/TMEM64 family protein [Salarchaeum sp. JOR-1]QDX41047.1 TVP38/TMEM64 family protein [Salarchaeum sp. JOR-1]
MRSLRLFRSHETRRSAVVALATLLAALVVLTAVFSRLGVFSTPAELRAFLGSFGRATPVAFVLLQAMQVVAAPVPGQVLSFVSGYLFGPVWGTAYSVLGASIGSYAAFWLSRTYGRPYAERVVAEDAFAWFETVTDDNGLLALFLVFLIPGLPDDVVCFVAGLTDLDLTEMTVVAALGRLPGFFLAALAGSNAAAGDYASAVVIATALGLVGLVCWVYRERVRAALSRV